MSFGIDIHAKNYDVYALSELPEGIGAGPNQDPDGLLRYRLLNPFVEVSAAMFQQGKKIADTITFVARPAGDGATCTLIGGPQDWSDSDDGYDPPSFSLERSARIAAALSAQDGMACLPERYGDRSWVLGDTTLQAGFLRPSGRVIRMIQATPSDRHGADLVVFPDVDVTYGGWPSVCFEPGELCDGLQRLQAAIVDAQIIRVDYAGFRC